MISHSVQQRTSETARVELGAEHDILKIVVSRVPGLPRWPSESAPPPRAALTRLTDGLLFSVAATDPLTFGGGIEFLP